MTTGTRTDVLRYTAFSSDPAGGNPAGVVLDASGLDERRMLALAAEVGYSETAFVTAADPARRRFAVRYFSPLAEVDFCGHATVATAVALAERVGPGELILDTRAGEIPVLTAVDRDGRTRATLTSVPTWSRPATDAEVDAALAALGWARDELDPALPPHVAFGGVHHLVLAAARRARLADLAYDFDGLAAVMRRHGWTTVHLAGGRPRTVSTPATPSRWAGSSRTRRPARPPRRSAVTCGSSGWFRRRPGWWCGRARTWAARANWSWTSTPGTRGYGSPAGRCPWPRPGRRRPRSRSRCPGLSDPADGTLDGTLPVLVLGLAAPGVHVGQPLPGAVPVVP